MRDRLSIVLSASALVVALLGATPLGHAAGRVVHTVPPFAARAGFAKFAGTADNAKRLAHHKASTTPKAGDIPVVGANGKLPASIGAVGPEGPRGPAGPAGPKGDDGKPASSLWAAVRANGTLVKGQGVASVVKDPTFMGTYTVTFTQDVSSCAILADQTERVVRSSAAEPAGGAVVKIITYVTTPPVFPLQDAPFAIAVFC